MAVPLASVRIGMLVAFVVAVVATPGCSPSGPPIFPVSGKVTWQKKPLPVGNVLFYPDPAKGNNSKDSAAGQINEDGTYSLTTAGRDGAPLGWYKVAVTTLVPPAEVPTEKGLPKIVEIPAKYLKPDTSGISIEVKENAAPGAYDIELK